MSDSVDLLIVGGGRWSRTTILEIVKMTEVNILLFSDNLFNYGIVENVHLAACHFIIEQVNLILGRDL